MKLILIMQKKTITMKINKIFEKKKIKYTKNKK